MDEQQGPLEEPAGVWFVNRRAELDLFWQWATGIPHPGRRSFALIGLRRTGKTAILHKTFNRLFNEQTRVLPVYISFARYLQRVEPLDAYEFAKEYFVGLLRSYLAFRYRQPDLLDSNVQYEQLRAYAETVGDAIPLEWLHIYELELSSRQPTRAHSIMQWAINLPKAAARKHNLPTAVIVDEFQVLTRVFNPDNQRYRNLTDSFQQASETRYAPLLISGSSVSMMVGDALGGMLSGRFQSKYIGPLTQEHAIDMALRLGKSKGLAVTTELALALWEWTHGYPYSIECLLNSTAPALALLPDLDGLREIVLYEVTNREAALWKHFDSEYGKYVRALNGDETTRKLLFWLTHHPGEHIHPGKVADYFGLEVLQVRDALEKLYKIDLIDRASISTYRGPTDPLLLEFLRYEHYIDLEDLTPEAAEAKVRRELNAKQGEMNRLTGHFTEIIVAGVMNNYDQQQVDGERYFSVTGSVTLPRMARITRRTGVIQEGEIHEIDVVGEYQLHNQQEGNAGLGAWLVAVRYRQERMGVAEVEAFIQHAAALQAEKGYGAVTRWFFSKGGFTTAALQRLQAEGIYASDLTQFNALADRFGLLPLTL